jgi:Ca2+-binding RTX toxin-like protein
VRRASLSDRPGTVRTPRARVTLDGKNEDGPAGENDIIAADVRGVIGSPRGDYIVGNDHDNVIFAADRLFNPSGNDTIYGLGGNDSIRTAVGNDYVDAGAGDDSVKWLTDPLVAPLVAEQSNYEPGFQGHDTIHGGDGNDTLEGTMRDDLVSGPTLYGGAGDDRLVRGALLVGGGGRDELIYGTTMSGGNGNDRLWGRPVLSEQMFGGAGNDYLTNYVFTAGDQFVTGPDRGPHRGRDTIDGGDGTDEAVGGANDDAVSIEILHN